MTFAIALPSFPFHGYFCVINKSRLKITIITTATAGIIDFKIGNKSSNIQNARRLGLGYNCANLGSFESVGGERFICKQLIRLVSKDMIEGNMRQSLEDFCEKSRINFDEAIAQCINGICNGRSNEMNISEAASLVRLSSDPQLKCQNILNILRAALLCKVRPSCLNELSKDTIKIVFFSGNL